MKILKLLLAASVSYGALTTAAHADPVTTALFGAAFASTFAGEVVSFGIGLAVTYGISLVQKAIAGKQDTASNTATGTTLNIQMGDDQPISFTAGNFATAGKRKYIGSWGDDGKTPNAYLTDVVELGNIPNTGLTGMWISDSKVTILLDQPEPNGLGFPVQEYRADGKDYLWVKFYDGTQTSADPYLLAKFGTDPDRPYTADMIGRGCPYAIVTSRFNSDLFSGGSPTYLFEVGSIKLYDLRFDSTNGGSGAQRWNDPSTWQPTNNNAVIIYNVIRGIYFGSQWMYGGQNLAAFRLPASNWIAAANACDLAVALSTGGTEPSFRAGYEFKGDEKPADAIEKLRKGCNARIAEVGGVFKILIGSPGAAVYAFTDDDIVITEEQTQTPFPSLTDTVNALEATYPEPAEQWATKDAPGRYNDDLEAEDGNRRLPESVTFEATPYPNQVQRLMLAMVQEERRFRVHQLYLPPDAYALEPNDVVAWSSDRNGYSNKKFLIDKISGQRTFRQIVSLKEIDPSDYDWDSSNELPTSIGWVGTITPPPQPMYGWQVEPAVLTDSAGQPWRPTIKVSAAPDQDDVRNVWVQVRLKATEVTMFDSQQTPYAEPYSWLINANFQGNTDYEARGKFIPYSNRATQWSDWLSVTTPNVATDDLVVDLQHVKQDVLDTFKDIFKQLDDNRSLLEQLMGDKQLTDVVFSQDGRRLSSQLDQASATFTEQIATVVDDVSAVAEQTTEVAADLNGRFAEGLIEFRAASDQTGVAARYAIALRAGEGDDYQESGLYLELKSVGGTLQSQLSVLADQFVVLNPDSLGTSYLPLVFSGGVLKLNVANIGTVTAGLINGGPSGKMVIDITNGSIVVSD